MNKQIFITGGAGGLGLEIAKRHLSLGDRVLVLDVEETSEVTDLLSKNDKISFVKCDISRDAYVQEALKDIATKIGKIDYFYSCAGIFSIEERVPLPELNLDDAAPMYDINAVGFLRVVQILFDSLQDGSVVMCVTSEAGSLGECPRGEEFNYCMSKAAQNMACVLLQNHYDNVGLNIRVMCIHPGWMRTKMGGEDAAANPDRSIAPEVSAEAIIDIALDIENIPKERMYMDYKRVDIAW